MDVVSATQAAIHRMAGLAAGRYRRARVSSTRWRIRPPAHDYFSVSNWM